MPFWNEQYADLAYFSLPYDEVTLEVALDAYYCEHLNDAAGGCQNPKADYELTAKDSRTVVVWTGDGNYFKVGLISDADSQAIEYQYAQLTQDNCAD